MCLGSLRLPVRRRRELWPCESIRIADEACQCCVASNVGKDRVSCDLQSHESGERFILRGCLHDQSWWLVSLASFPRQSFTSTKSRSCSNSSAK